MIWLSVSVIGLVIVVFVLRYYYLEHKEIQSIKKRWLSIILLTIASAASESTLLYLGLLLILFGFAKAARLL